MKRIASAVVFVGSTAAFLLHCGSAPTERVVANEGVAALVGCAPGETWDEGQNACRPTRTCADVSCAAPQRCKQDTPDEDAYCGENPCPSGEGVDPQTGACRPCADGYYAPLCNAAGETGKVLKLESNEWSECICETKAGYYFPAFGGNTAASCDSDHDGWVTEAAQPAIDSDNPVIRSNARCDLRRVAKIVVENEGGEDDEATAPDLRARFPPPRAGEPAGLPLYESPRNDGLDQLAPAPYGPLGGGRALNSLTKACLTELADVNHNGLADVGEGATSRPLVQGRVGANNRLLNEAYAVFTENAYFLELFDGSFEPKSVERPYAVYRIRERNRRDTTGFGVSVRDRADASPYLRECPRKLDTAYAGAVPNRAGGDFTGREPSSAFSGIGHTSQYKCVRVTGESTYKAQLAATDVDRPEVVFARGGGVLRVVRSSGAEERLDWALSACTLEAGAEARPSGSPARSPVLPAVRCTPVEPHDGVVAFASVQGFSYRAGVYVRGCIDRCVEHSVTCGANQVCDSTDGFPICRCQTGAEPLSAPSTLAASTGGCVDVAGAGAVVSSCGANATFTFRSLGDGTYQLARGTQCLAIEAGRLASAPCVSLARGTPQALTPHPFGGRDAAFRFEQRAAGLCMRAREDGSLEAAPCDRFDRSQSFAVGGAAACREIDECVYENGGCGNPAQTRCKDRHLGVACEDIDECATNNGGCGDPRRVAICVNQAPGYACSDVDDCGITSCGPGYRCVDRPFAPAVCEDVNECAAANACPAGHRCVNTPGAFRCDDIDECKEGARCGAGEVCLNKVGGYTCACAPPRVLDPSGRCVQPRCPCGGVYPRCFTCRESP
jgi:hypothetical protein